MQAEEAREKEAERIAEVLNEENFKVPEIPLRRSTRTTKAPTKYTDEPTEKNTESAFIEVTKKCNQQHLGIGCAAKDANHFPEYYDSVKNVINEKCLFNIFNI